MFRYVEKCSLGVGIGGGECVKAVCLCWGCVLSQLKWVVRGVVI